MLYMEMQKALYGLLRSALLFYKRLVKDLEQYGVVLNPYDPYITNMMIDGHQMTVTWYVDDIKVYHKDPFQVTKCACYLQLIYGKTPTVKRGKIHDYLGMKLDFSERGRVKVSMIKSVGKIFWVKFTSATPAVDHLFKVRDQDEANPCRESRQNYSTIL